MVRKAVVGRCVLPLGRGAEISMECADRAQRLRRFGVGRAFRSRSQSGVALHLPPHSKESSVVARFMEILEPEVVRAAGLEPAAPSV